MCALDLSSETIETELSERIPDSEPFMSVQIVCPWSVRSFAIFAITERQRFQAHFLFGRPCLFKSNNSLPLALYRWTGDFEPVKFKVYADYLLPEDRDISPKTSYALFR